MAQAKTTSTTQVTPVPFRHQPELRALMVLPAIPPGHMTFPVTDDTFMPHLRPGELAVIDMSDRQPENGELFLIGYAATYLTGPGIKHRLCQTLQRARSAKEAEPTFWFARHGMRRGCYGDGDFTTDYLSEKLVGRVVGIFEPHPTEGTVNGVGHG